MNYEFRLLADGYFIGLFQFRVLSCKVFGKNTTRSEAEAWRFFPKPEGLDLAGQWDTELPLPNEIGVGN